MQEVCFFMMLAIYLTLFGILREIRRIERKIEDANKRPKHRGFWGNGK